jgi:endonuclease YncB( thermonuclease family)
VPASLYLTNQSSVITQCLKRLALLIVLQFISIPAFAELYRVVAVSDGDTLTIEPIEGGDRAKVRLHGIDAPELRQPYGEAAKTFTLEAVLFKEIDVRPMPQGTDRYGRMVAIVEIPGSGILQELLLEAGLVWVYPNYCKNCGDWETIQEQARGQRIGLWTDENPIEPWEWRKSRREEAK